jgi:hypothetical protein
MLSSLFNFREKSTPVTTSLPRLELSGPVLAESYQAMVHGCEALGGVERYVSALKLKHELFAQAAGEDAVQAITEETFAGLCAFMGTVRRRIATHLHGEKFIAMKKHLAELLADMKATNLVDQRVDVFCQHFPEDNKHRWVRDLAAEMLHNVDPHRYPLMTRWMWDRKANTGVIRELWHGEDVDGSTIELADGHTSFVALRADIGGWLSENGVYNDTIYYVDLLCAQIYANYICAQGGTYLRADFASPHDPMQYSRRLLGLDGIKQGSSRTRLKAEDGSSFAFDINLLEDMEKANGNS